MSEALGIPAPSFIDLLRAAALLLGFAAAGHAALTLAAGLGRRRHERRRNALELERFQEELRSARARRVERGRARETWSGYRKFRVVERLEESSDVATFTLVAHDGKPIPTFVPGQYLTFRVRPGAHGPHAVRCYSLSSRPEGGRYRISVKRLHPAGEVPPDGRPSVSSWFHDAVSLGDILDVKSPAGDFELDLFQPRPVVLIGGGIGVTPLLAMLDALTARGLDREVWLFHGVRTPDDALRLDWLRERVRDAPGRLRVHLCHSRATRAELPSDDVLVHHTGRVDVPLLERQLPSANYDFHVCGPAAMMETLTRGLSAWGVDDRQLHLESFGPASVRGTAAARASDDEVRAPVRVEFARSGLVRTWDPSAGNLLAFAEQHGVTIESGCRAGSCGSCVVALKDGEVRNLGSPGEPPEPGSCLACIAIPTTDIVLEA